MEIKHPNLKTTRSTSNGPYKVQRIQRKNKLILWRQIGRNSNNKKNENTNCKDKLMKAN
jgi:hypothetical protein